MADSAPRTDPKDPRFRRFRAATYGLYLIVTVGFCISLIVQVYRSTYAMTYGSELAPAKETLSVRECVDRAEGLFNELEARRKELGAPPYTTADQRWLDTRSEWVRRYRELEAGCALDSRSRKSLRALFERLQKVADLFTTHAVQYAGQLGPGLDELRLRFAEIRKDPDMGRLP